MSSLLVSSYFYYRLPTHTLSLHPESESESRINQFQFDFVKNERNRSFRFVSFTVSVTQPAQEHKPTQPFTWQEEEEPRILESLASKGQDIC